MAAKELSTKQLLYKILDQLEHPNGRSSRLGKLWAWASGVIAVAGLIAFWPRMTVTQSDPVDSENVFSAAFAITNTGWMPLHNVQVAYAPREMTYVGHVSPSWQGRDDYSSELLPTSWKEQEIGIDERATVTIAELIPSGPIETCDMAIVVVYQPWYFPWKSEKKFRFVARRQTNQHLYWYAEPLP